MTADVDVVNLALRALGSARIISLTDGSKNANAANDVYALIRDQVLRTSNWNFATTRVKLTEVGTAPAFGFDHQFAFPSDWLRTVSVTDNDAGFGAAIVQEETFGGQRVFLTDSDALYLKYVYRLTDPNLFPADFIIAFAIELAKRLSTSIAASNTIKADLTDEVKGLWLGSKSTDSQGQTPQRRPPGSWVSARFGWRQGWPR